MTRQAVRLALAAIACLVATAVFAQAFGRVVGTVSDETGVPVAGMKITVLDLGKTATMVETETDSKGAYRLQLDDAEATYVYQLDKKGFAPFETSFEVPAGKESEMNFTVLSAEAAKRGAPAMFNEGAAAAKGGDMAQAESKFRGALELDPELAPAHAALGQVLFRQERYEPALRSAQRALELVPDNDSYRDLRDAILDKEGMAAARAALEQTDPQLAAASHFKQGMELFDKGDAAEAQAALEAAVAADPEHARGHYMLGLTLANLGRNAEAGEHLARFLELAPEDPDAAGAREMVEYFKGLE